MSLETPDNDEIRALLRQGDHYYASLYPAASNHLVDIDMLKRPEVTFIVARLLGQVCGFGAILTCGDYVELKRMYICQDMRGKGLGRALLEKLEAEARGLGIFLARLETGIKQPEALGLYKTCGYQEIAPFGAYLFDPLSIFMEKRLST